MSCPVIVRSRRAKLAAGAAAGIAGAVVLALGCGVPLRLPFGLTVNFPGFTGEAMTEPELAAHVRLPPGFSVGTFAGGIDGVRMLRFTPAGDLLASSPRQDTVFLLERDANGDGVADGRRALLTGLDSPHGIALHGGWLYVAEADAVLRVRFDADTRGVAGVPERIVRGLPRGGNHWTRTIGVGPDERLYVSVGSSCNVCIEKDPRRAAITRYRLDGSDESVHATGLRNAVGFAWRPETGELYATDNGRDLLGDDFPPCELNRVVAGGFYGWPFANGTRIPDPDYGAGKDDLISASIPPVHGFAAHTAPLGIGFYSGSRFPERYRGAAFAALHGSWNRLRKSGYKVVALFFGPGGAVREEDFVTGFEIDEKVYGRPVDVAEGPDGALYVSDDFTGSVYRVAYGESGARAAGVPPREEGGAAEQMASLPPEAMAAALSRGRLLWESTGCVECHAPGGRPDAYRPLADLKAKHTIGSLADFLRAPQPPMPAFPLSADQRRDLAVFLLSTY